jgi:hypothetical protein
MANERSPAGGPSGLIAASKTIVACGQLIRRSSHADDALTCTNAPMTDAAGSVSPRTVRMTAATAESELTAEDRMSSFVAGYELGKAERVDIEIEDQVQARIHGRVREALGMAKQSARHGPGFSQLVTESGERQ